MSDRCIPFLLGAALVLVTGTSFLPVLEAGFVDFDDAEYVYGNAHVATGLSLENARWAFTRSHSANWHPLTWLSHMVDVELFGLESAGHHATNLLLHIANTVLVFLLLRSLTGREWASFVVALSFGIHPINVEPVAWVSQRKTLLSTLFAILAIGAYASYVRRGTWRPYAGSLALFALSLMSKQTFVTLPLLLLLLDYWPLRRPVFRAATDGEPMLRTLLRGGLLASRDKLPFLLLAGVASVVTLTVQRDAMQSLEGFPLPLRLANVALAYVGYLRLLAWPAALSVFYPLYPDEIARGKVIACLALLLGITAVAFLGGRRRRPLLVGWLWFLVALVPVIGVVQVGAQSMADRYAYGPFWGLLIVIVWSAAGALEHGPRSTALRLAAAGVAACVAIGLAWATFQRTKAWHDTISLFEDAVSNTERNWLAHRSLAAHYFAIGDYQKSLRHCEAGIPLGRDLGTFLATCGLTLHESGEKQRGIEQLQEATRIAPDHPMGFLNLGWVWAEAGRHDLAVEQFARAAARLRPEASDYAFRMVHANWARSLWHLGRAQEAAEQFDLVLARDPDQAFVLRDAAAIDLELGRTERALQRLERAVALDPDDATAARLLAEAQRRFGVAGPP